MKLPEQVCPHEKSRRFRKALKRRVIKERRAREKRDPENAPVRNRYRGYST